MPTKVADELADKFVGHDVNLLRLQATQRRAMLRALRQLERKLETKIAQHIGDATFTLQRNRVLLRETRRVIATGYDQMTTAHKAMLKEMGEYELGAVTRIVNGRIGIPLLSVGVPHTVIDAMLNNDTIFGAPLQSYWRQQSLTLQNRFALAMRAGIFAGETTQQLMQRVRGTRARNFEDGLMRTARHGAEVVVRTAAQSILNDARMASFRANADVIKGVQALVTLDTRTSEICMARSGFAWSLDGTPMAGTRTDEDFPGPPPWHPNCRSTLIPIPKTFGELTGNPQLDAAIKRELKTLPKSTQASMNGQVAEDLTYEQWLKTQPKATQVAALGPGKWQLWSQKKINLRDLIDQSGNPLTLTELKALE